MIKYKDKKGEIHIIEEGRLFVTKDKHGKDVFAKDFCNYDCCGNFHKIGIGYFMWDKDILGWALQDTKRKKIRFYIGTDFSSKDIALIKDKEDE